LRKPFSPQSLEVQQDRFVAAGLGKATCLDDAKSGIFDFADGVRIFVSDYATASSKSGELHVTATLHESSQLYADAESGKFSYEKFLKLSARRFSELSKTDRPLLLAGASHGEIMPHWILPKEGDNAEEI
jgi:hypothetical protein